MLTIARNDALVLRRDAMFIIVMTVMPIALMAFMKPALQAALQAEGVSDASGAEQAVPGMAVMFGFLLIGVAGWNVFQEHIWGTWTRIRASSLSAAEIMVGKAIVPLATSIMHFAVLMTLGSALFGLRFEGSVLALSLVGIAWTVSLTTFAMMLVAVVSNIRQFNALANVVGLVFAGLGGAITPLESLPGWAQPLAPLSPAYWAMRGFRTVIIDGGGVVDVAGSIGVLVGFALVLFALVVVRFDVTEAKSAHVT